MARGMHPNSLANLKKGRPIQEQPNSRNGRTPMVKNVIKTIPRDAQEKVYHVLWTAGMRAGIADMPPKSVE